MRRRDKGEDREVAAQRLRQLLQAARKESRGGRQDLADRYAGLAQLVARKHQTGLRGLCRACGALALPATTRTRIRGGRIATTCLRCGDVRRRPLRSRT